MKKDLRGNILKNKKIFEIFGIEEEAKEAEEVIKEKEVHISKPYIEEALKCRLSE